MLGLQPRHTNSSIWQQPLHCVPRQLPWMQGRYAKCCMCVAGRLVRLQPARIHIPTGFSLATVLVQSRIADLHPAVWMTLCQPWSPERAAGRPSTAWLQAVILTACSPETHFAFRAARVDCVSPRVSCAQHQPGQSNPPVLPATRLITGIVLDWNLVTVRA
jgi:hypothetical protein